MRTMDIRESVFPILEKHLCEPAPKEGVPAIMTMERFQRHFLWFGRWFESPGEPLIDEMVNLFQAPWYFHEMSSIQAQTCLTGCHGGTFIIRLSLKDRRQPFALSVMLKNKGEILHSRIHRLSYDPSAEERYSFPGFGTFRFISELVDLLIKKGLVDKPFSPESKDVDDFDPYTGMRR